MKARIYKREGPHGKHYSVIVELGRDADGRRQQKWHSAGTTKAEAEDKLDEVLRQLSDRTYVAPTKLTVGAYLDDYVAGLKRRIGQAGRKGLASGTWDSYRRIVKYHLKPELGSLKLADLTAHHVEKYETKMLESGWAHGKARSESGTRGLSPTTVAQHHRVLHKALREAVRKGLIRANVCDAVRAPGAAVTHLRTLDAKEAAGLLRTAQGTPLHMPVLLALTTGMRAAEIAALRWSQVDVEHGVLRVSHSKSEAGVRSIALDATTTAALKAARDGRKVRHLKRDDYVVTNESGQPLTSNLISQMWRRFAQSHDLKDLRFHDLRHTHATLLAQAGEHPRVVQERLGHADVAFTTRRYTGSWDNMQAGAAAKIGKLLGPAVGASVESH